MLIIQGDKVGWQTLVEHQRVRQNTIQNYQKKGRGGGLLPLAEAWGHWKDRNGAVGSKDRVLFLDDRPSRGIDVVNAGQSPMDLGREGLRETVSVVRV